MPAEVLALPQFRGLKGPHYLTGSVGGGNARNGSTESWILKWSLRVEREVFVSLFFLNGSFLKI